MTLPTDYGTMRNTSIALFAGAMKFGRGRSMNEARVKMYTLSTCSHCKAAKRLMHDLGVKFEYTDVDLLSGSERQAAMDEVRRLNPMCSFPTIVIGDAVIVGTREDKIKEALGLL